MFLIRTAFWLSVIILLLPAEESSTGPQQAAQANVDATSVISAARSTVSDISGICERSPDVCQTGGAALDTFVKKARYGAGLVSRAIWGDTYSPQPSRAVQTPQGGQMGGRCRKPSITAASRSRRRPRRAPCSRPTARRPGAARRRNVRSDPQRLKTKAATVGASGRYSAQGRKAAKEVNEYPAVISAEPTPRAVQPCPFRPRRPAPLLARHQDETPCGTAANN